MDVYYHYTTARNAAVKAAARTAYGIFEIFPNRARLSCVPVARDRAYSKAVLRVHGMDEAGVRLPVGPLESLRMCGMVWAE